MPLHRASDSPPNRSIAQLISWSRSSGSSAIVWVSVRTASEGSDQSLGVSPLSARTCTWYSVSAVSPVMVVVVAVSVCVQSSHVVAVLTRYSTL